MSDTIEILKEKYDDHRDDHVDEEIRECFSKDNPKSFFVFAGAGSGKTRSLVKTLNFLEEKFGDWFRINQKQIAVITFTNAACDEISKRLQYRSIFWISTIHSFIWELIKNYQKDIKEWLIQSLEKEITNLKAGMESARNKESKKEKIDSKKRRLDVVKSLTKFTYNPNGDNLGAESLNHNEVVKMGSEFISTKETMKKIIISKYPIILIDESQDTKKELVDAFFALYETYKGKFIIGMFGDTMQRIYMDGKENLHQDIPDDWAKPEKVMNHRSAVRIVTLANDIRRTIDNQQQQYRSDAEKGTVRLFIASCDSNKEEIEQKVKMIMAKEANDEKWLDDQENKILILEHQMAAARLGFLELFLPLRETSLDTSLRDGTIPELSFLSHVISPLVLAYKENNDFEVFKILKKYSPLLDKKRWEECPDDQTNVLKAANEAFLTLMKLWENNKDPMCTDIFCSIQKTGLFALSNRINDILDSTGQSPEDIKALKKALSVPFSTLEKYAKYVSDNTEFATHQGVKGLEFPRVIIIMDDKSQNGKIFSYEKLFGAIAQSETDKRNISEGKDNCIARTTRLFYVACTRAQKSLAVIAYTQDCEKVKSTALKNKWFMENEIQMLQ